MSNDPPLPAPTISVGIFTVSLSDKNCLLIIRQDSLEPPINNRCIIHVIKYNHKNGGVAVNTETNAIVDIIDAYTAFTISIRSLTLAYSQARWYKLTI